MAYWLAYAIFSLYIPLAKNSTRVVTLTNNNPETKYLWRGGGFIFGSTLRMSQIYGRERNEVGRKISESRIAMSMSSCKRNTEGRSVRILLHPIVNTHTGSETSCVGGSMRLFLDAPRTGGGRGKS